MEKFQELLNQPLTPHDKAIIKSFKDAQEKYGLLTKKRYVYFWTIHNKYLPIEELEYSETMQVSGLYFLK